MARHHITAGSAFETLVADSRSSHVAIVELAHRLVASGADGDAGPATLTVDH
jgi:hypothetical protein